MLKKVCAVAALAIMLLAGCGSGEKEVRYVEVQPDPSPTPTLTENDMERLFVDVVTEEFPEYVGQDDELVETGRLACEALDSGATLDDFVAEAQADPTIDIEAYAFILGAATVAFCPEYSDMFDGSSAV